MTKSLCASLIPAILVWLSPFASTLGADGTEASSSVNWQTGEGVKIGGVLSPHLHFQSVYGGTTADELPEIGHHDPRMDGWTIQGFEVGLSGRFTDKIEAFSTYHLFYDQEAGEWGDHFEEWFGKIKDLPGGLELRGGRYLNRFGFHNQLHLHAWDFVDSSLVAGRFLGDDGLYTVGGEVTWTLPVPWTSLLSVSLGVPPEAEGHDHDEEGPEPEFEAPGALFDDVFVVANWTNQFEYNDFHRFRAGLSGTWGDNKWGKTSQIYASHFEYQWKENGFDPGGRYLRWRTEAMLRSFDAVSGPLPEEGPFDGTRRTAGLDEFGVYSSIIFGLASGLEFGLRGDYVSGIQSAGLDERFRVSPVLTYFLNANHTVYFRAQYNLDHSNDFGTEHSLWAQVGFNWGGAEVR